ncbi:MAG: ASKHA domain-containing protein [Paracoccaceae bacterium]|nr:ASKHA domain-containing protein [Paracoccaceae bacterium]
MVSKAKVVFMPSGKRGEFPIGTNLLDASRALGVDLDTVCGGRAVCGRCQIEPSFGEFAKLQISSQPANFSVPGPTEEKYKRIKGLKSNRRLGCQSKLLGDVVVDIPQESQIHRQMVRKNAEDIGNLTIDPVVILYYVELPKPSMEDQRSDLERISSQLLKDWDVSDLEWDIITLQDLSAALRSGEAYGGDFVATVAVRNDKKVTAIWSGFKERIFGIAVDVGTTTVAGHLCELDTGKVVASSGIMNPQIRYGEDLMSRISYLQQNENEAKNLTLAIQDALADLVHANCIEAGIEASDILEMTIVGNPTMHHLVMGIDPTQLGMEPFPLVVDQGISILARDLNLPINKGGYIWFLPCIAGHVGADTAGVILSQVPHLRDEMTLVIDVGTNAEIVLGQKDKLIACSSPTGPAFEGAQITCGQRAAPGAIERVRVNRKTLMPRFKVIGVEMWSDENGFAEAAKDIGISGICGSGIIEAVAELHLSGIVDSSGRMQAKNLDVVVDHPNFVAKGRNFEYILYREGDRVVYVAPSDIRAIQLAKSACYSGVRLLMDRMGTDHVDRIYLAGAFGSYIDVGYAMAIGLIPDCQIDQVSSAGNAAGTGARIALLSASSRIEIDRVCRLVDKVETAIEPAFQEYFVAAMSLPHSNEPFEKMNEWLTKQGLGRV